jgi:hypothetical protein
MNRCLPDRLSLPQPHMKPRNDSAGSGWTCLRAVLPAVVAVVASVAFAALSSPASAQGFKREFPPAAKRAVFQVTAPPEVLLNGAPARLSPGARIHGLTNTLVMSGQIVGQRLVVNYLRDTQGMVHQVWILSETEAQQKRAGTEPTTNFTWGSDAVKPNTARGAAPYSPSPN